MNDISKLSMSDARTVAVQIAEDFARGSGWEGALLSAERNSSSTDRRGRTPVQWVAVFRNVLRGVEYDGPRLVQVDIEAGKACASPAD